MLVMEAWGRRPALQVSAAIFNIGAIVMTAATHQLSMICELYHLLGSQYESHGTDRGPT